MFGSANYRIGPELHGSRFADPENRFKWVENGFCALRYLRFSRATCGRLVCSRWAYRGHKILCPARFLHLTNKGVLTARSCRRKCDNPLKNRIVIAPQL